MKKLLKSTILIILFLSGLLHFNYTTAQVKGNGKVITQKIEVKPFEKLHINFPVRLTLDANADYALSIKTDENILSEIVLKNDNNQLKILQDKWIQPSQMVTVIIGTKGLTTFTIGGYGIANIFNLNEPQLEINNNVGKVILSGKVNTLTFKLHTGELDAKKLEAQNIKGSISGHGQVYVNAKKSIDANVSDDGKLVYLKMPEIFNIEGDGKVLSLIKDESQPTKVNAVKYVNVELYNNRHTRINTFVEGPKNRNFSYGMPFNPKQKRTERYPVGTKIFKVGKIGIRKLLLTIKAEDEGEIVDLFQSN